MIGAQALEPLIRRPKILLTLGFTIWKSLLFAIALASPGSGYDTSTTLLHPSLDALSRPFVRWDAIYFTQIAQRGYLFEQDWAFSWGFTRLIRGVSKRRFTSMITRVLLLTLKQSYGS